MRSRWLWRRWRRSTIVRPVLRPVALKCWRRPGRFGGLRVEPVHCIWRHNFDFLSRTRKDVISTPRTETRGFVVVIVAMTITVAAAIPPTRGVFAPSLPIFLQHSRSLIRLRTSRARARRSWKVLDHAPTTAISANRGANRRRVGDRRRHAMCVCVRKSAGLGVVGTHPVWQA